MAGIQIFLDRIRNAVYGKEVRQSIHDAIKQCYDDATANGNANMEVSQARGTHTSLANRLTSQDASIGTKRDKDILITMSDIGQDVKEAMTGGSVAVVGKNSVLSDNIVDGQVSIGKLSRDIAPATSNLYDKSIAENGRLMGNNPSNPTLQNYAAAISSGFVPIQSTGDYIIYQGGTKVGTICFLTAEKTALYAIGYTGNQYGSWDLPTANQVTRTNVENFTRLSIKDSRVKYIWWYMSGSENYLPNHTVERYQEIIDSTQLNFGGVLLPYEPYGYYIDGCNIKGYNDVTQSVDSLNNDMATVKEQLSMSPELTVEGNAMLTVSENIIQVRTRLDDQNDIAVRMIKSASSNGGLTFSTYVKLGRSVPYTDVTSTAGTVKGAGDDICPLKVDDLYIGGNHGWPVVANITGEHDKAAVDIGSVWMDENNREFVLLQVAENTLRFVRTSGTLSMISLPLTHISGATNTTAVATGTASYAGQLYPSLYGCVQHYYVDGKEVTGDGVYAGRSVKIAESYEIIDLVPTLITLQESVGSNSNESYFTIAQNHDYSVLRQTVVYDYNNTGGCTVTTMVNMRKSRESLRLNGVQSMLIGTSIMVPMTTSYQTPVIMDTSTIDINKEIWSDPDTPPSAFIQFNPEMRYITVLGYHDALDSSQKLRATMDSVGQYSAQFKMYPCGLYKQSPKAGDTYTCIAYRCIGEYTNNVYIGQYAVNGDHYAIIVTLGPVDTMVELPFGNNGDVIDTVYTDGTIQVGKLCSENQKYHIYAQEPGYCIVKKIV